MRKDDIVDSVDDALRSQEVPIGLREKILDDVWFRLSNEMEDED